MSDLKTLKDIENNLTKDNLRAVALDWIKSDSPFLNDCDDSVTKWIIYFFNLEEVFNNENK